MCIRDSVYIIRNGVSKALKMFSVFVKLSIEIKSVFLCECDNEDFHIFIDSRNTVVAFVKESNGGG